MRSKNNDGTQVMSSAPLRILYVEDNELVREVTIELLVQDGRDIVAVETAEQALAEFAKQPFNLVITDVSLPVMSGLDLARSLLAQDSNLPLILATGYALDFKLQTLGTRVRSVTKPFDGPEIDAVIEEVVNL
jgi:CheY-like chemotaxis protein